MVTDCIKCWNTPCSCGWELRHYNVQYLEKQKLLIEKAIQFKKEHPHMEFHSDFNIDWRDETFFKFIRGV